MNEGKQETPIPMIIMPETTSQDAETLVRLDLNMALIHPNQKRYSFKNFILMRASLSAQGALEPVLLPSSRGHREVGITSGREAIANSKGDTDLGLDST